MDSLQGISVEYKLDTFNKPRTGTTLCHPKIGYVNVMLLFRSRHLAINLPLGHINGDNARVIFWVVGEKCLWLQNKERIDTHNNTVMML